MACRSSVRNFFRSDGNGIIWLTVFLHRLGDQSGRVFWRERGGVMRHGAERRGIAQQFADFLGQQFAREIGFLQKQGGVRPNEYLGIPCLMIVGRIRIGDKQGRQGKGGQLSEAGRAGTGDDEIGRTVNFFNMMMKRGDMRRGIFAPVIIFQQTGIATAGKITGADSFTTLQLAA